MHNVDGVAIGSCMLRLLRNARFRVCREDEGYFLSDSGRGDSESRCTGVETERRGEDGFGGRCMAVAKGESTMIVMGDEGTVGNPMGGGRRLALDRGILKLGMRKAVLCAEAEGGTQLADRSLSRSSSGDVVEEDDSSAFFSLSKPPPIPRSSASSSC